MSSYNLGFIGAGNMAEAIIKGILFEKFQACEIIASDIDNKRLTDLHNRYGIKIASDNAEVIKSARCIVLAVKPQYIKEVLEEIKENKPNGSFFISIAAGIKLEYLQEFLGEAPLIRVMPNTPALVSAGMTALAAGKYASSKHLEEAEEIFKAVGKTIVIEEKLLDAVTGVSGSGPAYVFQFIEAMADGGVQMGLPRKTAYTLAAQTVVGAGLMVLETGHHPAELKDMVTSPGGTTIRAVNVLEKSGMRAALMDAVEAACLTARNLSGENK